MSLMSSRWRKPSPALLSSTFDHSNDNMICYEISNDDSFEKLSRRKVFSLDKLRRLSNFASLLCVLDCTILPLVTCILPLLGLFNLDHDSLEWIHQFGHGLAFCFVLPVGSMSTYLNYSSHRKLSIAWMACLGLICVVMANLYSLPIIGHIEFLHTLHSGGLHRVLNIIGCTMILGSNYLTHQHRGCKTIQSRECCQKQPSPFRSSICYDICV